MESDFSPARQANDRMHPAKEHPVPWFRALGSSDVSSSSPNDPKAIIRAPEVRRTRLAGSRSLQACRKPVCISLRTLGSLKR